MTAKILIVDDHQMMLEGLRLLFREQPDMTVVGEALNAESAIKSIAAMKPDIVVMDVMLGETNGVALLREARSRYPDIKVIILTAFPDPDLINSAMEAGASGFLIKCNSSDELIRAIKSVMEGKQYLSPEVATIIMADYKKYLAHKTERVGAELSDREKEILRLIAEGLRTKEIATHLELSVKTVETHRARIMTKLECASVAELVRYALKEGISSL